MTHLFGKYFFRIKEKRVNNKEKCFIFFNRHANINKSYIRNDEISTIISKKYFKFLKVCFSNILAQSKSGQ